MIKVTFKYDYTLLQSGTVRTFKAGESVDFPADSPHIGTFRQQTDILTIEENKKKQK